MRKYFLVGFLFVPFTLSGQSARDSAAAYLLRPQIGIDAIYLTRINPDDTFANSGVGLQLRYTQPLDKFGVMGFRIDGSMSFLGGDQKTVTESTQFSTRETTVNLKDRAVLLTGAYQLQIPRGLLRPFAGVRGGMGRFSVDATIIEDSDYSSSPSDSVGSVSNTFVYGGYAGLQLQTGLSSWLTLGVDGLRTLPLEAIVPETVTVEGGKLRIRAKSLPALQYLGFYVGFTWAIR